MAQKTSSQTTPPAKHAVGSEREKQQPYATENEAYEGQTVKSPKNSGSQDATPQARAPRREIGKPAREG